MAVAQWVRRWSSCHKVVQAEGSSPGGGIYQIFLATIFISLLLGQMDFSVIVILCSRPSQQNFKCFDMPLLSVGFFS